MIDLMCRLMLVSCLCSLSVGSLSAHEYGRAAIDSAPTVIPDRVVLTWNGDPATSAAVTWRTNTQIRTSAAEIAKADASPNFVKYASRLDADLDLFEDEDTAFHSHSVTFEGLDPNTQYAYRVGSGDIWSEWFHFRTASGNLLPSRLSTLAMRRTIC